MRVKWINDLKDPATGHFLPHLLRGGPDPALGQPGQGPIDEHSMDPTPYTGPVPIVTHVHGAHVGDESDGYREAWFLPGRQQHPAGYATEGTWYDTFRPVLPPHATACTGRRARRPSSIRTTSARPRSGITTIRWA